MTVDIKWINTGVPTDAELRSWVADTRLPEATRKQADAVLRERHAYLIDAAGRCETCNAPDYTPHADWCAMLRKGAPL